MLDKEYKVVKALENNDFQRETLKEALLFRGLCQEALFALARQRRDEAFPSREVEVRSVIEISNVCQQGCNFCNMGPGSTRKRYVISLDETLHLTDHIYSQGRRVLMLQSGELRTQAFVNHVARCSTEIKKRYPDMELILCMGNLSSEHYQKLKDTGAERYLIKFETSKASLYESLKPRDTLNQRLACLENLLEIGFKVGSGNMVGLPGQNEEDIVDDLLLLNQYPLSMVSCTVFIPGEDSRLRDQPMGDGDLALNMMAIMRIMFPDRLIPTTSALERAKKDGQFLGLMAGGNTVTIHDGTPPALKELFPIYSVLRFAPTTDHMRRITHRAGLKFSKSPLATIAPKTAPSLA